MVADTLGIRSGRSASSRRSSVVLPTPDGPEMTTSLPGRVLIEQTGELVDVTLQPYQFLGDVGAISHEGYLAGNVGVGERSRPVGQECADPLQQPVAVGDHHLGHALADSSC